MKHVKAGSAGRVTAAGFVSFGLFRVSLVKVSLGSNMWQVQRDKLNSTLQKSAAVVGLYDLWQR